MLDYGSFLREERERLGILQKELAEGICHKDTISRIENGSQIPSAALFVLLAEQLGVSGYSYGELFSGGTVQILQLRWEIIERLNMLRLDDIPQLLEEYRCVSGDSGWDEQFFTFARGWYFYLVTGDHDAFLEDCYRALFARLPELRLEEISGFRLLQGDCRILNAMALGMQQDARIERGTAILNQLILNQKARAKTSFKYWENLAILYHNSAICEKDAFFDHAQRHMRMAENAVMRSGNPLLTLRIMRSKKLYFSGGSDESRNHREATLLKLFFHKVNKILGIYEDFWQFLQERAFLYIL